MASRDFVTYLNKESGELETANLVTGDVVVHDSSEECADLVKFRYSTTVAMHICQLVREGNSLARIATRKGMPSTGTISLWCRRYPDFDENLDAAREDRAEYFHDKVLDNVEEVPCSNDVPGEKLKFDKLKWLAEKGDAKRYGRANDGVGGPGAITLVLDTGIRRDGGEIIVVTDSSGCNEAPTDVTEEQSPTGGADAGEAGTSGDTPDEGGVDQAPVSVSEKCLAPVTSQEDEIDIDS